MAEAVAAIGLASAIASLVNYGFKLAKRLDEFDDLVKGLPEGFAKVRIQLPLLLNVVEHLNAQADRGELTPETASLLLPILNGVRKEITDFDDALLMTLPSAHASQREKIRKAIKSLSIQKRLDEFRLSIQDYLNTLAAFQHTRHTDALKDLTALVQSQQGGLPGQRTPRFRNPIWMVKYDSEEDFVGRHDIMQSLDLQMCEDDHQAALAGIGGVGKSRIAIQYCYRFSQERPQAHIFWVHGGSRSRFEHDYRKIARLLDLPGREDPEVDILRLVSDWFSYEADGSYLIVVDGADDRDIWLGPSARGPTKASGFSMPLIDYLPHGAEGHLLFTTRDRQLGHKLVKSKRQPLDVARLGVEESRLLLFAKLNEKLEQRDADELARELEHLPLTITQAAAYLDQTEITASEYLDIYRAGRSDIPNLLEESIDDPGRDREGSNSVFQTWRISFEHIAKQSSTAADVLSLMAVLDRQAISQELLLISNDNILEIKAAIAKLKAFSIIQEDSSAKFTLHRLVQLSTRRWLADHGKIGSWEQNAVIAVARNCPDVVTFEQWPLIQDLSPHIQSVLTYEIADPYALRSRAHIMHCWGQFLMERGQFELALQVLEESHTLRSRHYGNDHEVTLESLGLVGLAYSRLRRVKEARRTLQIFYASAELTLGPRHRLTLKSLSRLAATYNKAGELDEGNERMLKVLRLTEQELGTTSEEAIRLLVSLTYSYNKLCKWEEAEDIGLKALKLRTRFQGDEHPDTLTIMDILAWTYRAQNRFYEAEALEDKVLKGRIEHLGFDHPKTRRTMLNLAQLKGQVGHWKEAEKVQRNLVERMRRSSGVQHNNIRSAEFYLSLLQQVLGNPQDDVAVKKYLANVNKQKKSVKKAKSTREFTTQIQSQLSHVLPKNEEPRASDGDGSDGTSDPKLPDLTKLEFHNERVREPVDTSESRSPARRNSADSMTTLVNS